MERIGLWLNCDKRITNRWQSRLQEEKLALLPASERTCDEKRLKASWELGSSDAKEIREIVWESKLEHCLSALKIDLKKEAGARKSADWKVAIAGYMKGKHLCRNGWLGEKLEMGTEYGMSRYVEFAE